MEDEAGLDAKVLAVPHSKLTKLYDHVQEPQDLASCFWIKSTLLRELRRPRSRQVG